MFTRFRHFRHNIYVCLKKTGNVLQPHTDLEKDEETSRNK